MGIFFNNKNKISKVIIVDIGSGSVGACYVHIPHDKSKIPTIIKSFRIEIKTKENIDPNELTDAMLQALSSVIESIHNAKLGHVDEFSCVLSSPWYVSQTRIIKVSRDKEFVLSSKLSSSLIEKEVVKVNSEYDKQYNTDESTLQSIENHVVGIYLNGYIVEHPLGMRTSDLQMNILISLSPKSFLDMIRDTLHKHYYDRPITFSSFVLSSYIAVRDRYVDNDSYLLIDISGELSDVAIVSNNILKSSLSFPFGRNTFMRYIASELDISLKEAQDIFILYNKGTLDSSLGDKLKVIFTKIEDTWGRMFHEAINATPHILHIPETIFLTSNEDIREFFVNTLCNEEHIKSLITSRKCNVVVLKGPEFLNMCSANGENCDPFLMIESISFMRKI